MSRRQLTLPAHTADLVPLALGSSRCLCSAFVASPTVFSVPLQLGGRPMVWREGDLFPELSAHAGSGTACTWLSAAPDLAAGECTWLKQQWVPALAHAGLSRVDFRVASACVSVKPWDLSCRRADTQNLHRTSPSAPVSRQTQLHPWPRGPVVQEAACPDSCPFQLQCLQTDPPMTSVHVGSFPASSPSAHACCLRDGHALALSLCCDFDLFF